MNHLNRTGLTNHQLMHMTPQQIIDHDERTKKMNAYTDKLYPDYEPGYYYLAQTAEQFAIDLFELIGDDPGQTNYDILEPYNIAAYALRIAIRIDPTLQSRECKYYALRSVYQLTLKYILDTVYQWNEQKLKPYYESPNHYYHLIIEPYSQDKANLFDAEIAALEKERQDKLNAIQDTERMKECREYIKTFYENFYEHRRINQMLKNYYDDDMRD